MRICTRANVLGPGRGPADVSRHLKILHNAGLLAREKRGACVYYRHTADRKVTS